MSESRRRHSALLLIGLILVGWLAAPVFHGIEHAMEIAEATHQHERAPEGGLAEACETTVVALEECPLCLTRFAAESGPTISLGESVPEMELTVAEYSVVNIQSVKQRVIRGPPVVI